MKSLFKNVKHRAKLFKMECDIYIPDYKIAIEYDGSYWHRNKYLNDKEKTKLLLNKGIFVIRVRERGLRKITNNDIIYSSKIKSYDLMKELLNIILDKINLNIKHRKKFEFYLKNGYLVNEKEFIKLLDLLPSPFPEKSLQLINASLAQEWHPTKNGNLTPYDVTPGSHIKVWWICKKGHEWQAKVESRNKGNNCPYCGGKKVNEDNCLQTINPRLSKEWHPTKNGKLTPYDVTPSSHIKVWWICKKGHEWQSVINNRSNGTGCPYCSGNKVNKENCLQTIIPRLAQEWHPTKNGNLTAKDVTPGSSKKVWWKCKKDHEWQTVINNRSNGTGCPSCCRERRKIR